MNEFDNPYSIFALEQRFRETGSLIEHVLIMADFLEYQVNRIITSEEPNDGFAGMVRKANFTSDQRLGYAIGCASTILSMEGEDGDSLAYFIGRINEIYSLRRLLPTLSEPELEARVKRLYHVKKGDEKNWAVITTVIEAFNDVPGNPVDLPAVELFDHLAMPIYDFMIDFADEYQRVIKDLDLEAGEDADDGELMDLEEGDEA